MVVIGVLFYGGIAGAQDKAQAIASTADGNKFVGSVACKGCHAELWNHFYKKPA